MIDSIITKYLKNNKRITIPELGTLVRKDSEGIFVLVEFLRKDDGILAGLLRAETDLSEQEAATAVSGYVNQIKEEVEKHGSVSLKGIGILSRSDDGLYELDSVKVSRADDGTALDSTLRKPVRSAEPDSTPRRSDTRPIETVRPAAKRKAVTVDENGDPVGDDFFDDGPRHESKSSSMTNSVASIFTGAKGLVNSVRGKAESSEKRLRKSPSPKNTAGRMRSDNSDREVPADTGRHSAEGNKRFSDLRPQPEIRGLRYKSSGRYAKRKSPMDRILLVAIIAAVLAIGVMVYGQLVNKRNKPEPLIDVQTEIPEIHHPDTASE